jgi:GTP-binding protein HflX
VSELLEENPSGRTGADRYGEPVTTPAVNRPRRQSRRLTATVTDLGVGRQRAFLIGVQLPGVGMAEAERSLEELALLTDTAGSDAIDRELVRRPVPDAAYLIGKGKASDLAAATNALDIDVVVVDAGLSPAQQRNLQKLFGCDVVDREALILDIFAQHAHSKIGSLQVELALLRYRLPRLRGRGTELSQQAGGIGTRGPGETKLESDRRRIEQRITRLEKELKDVARSRTTQRKARRRNEVPQVALVGYTNAGKSTLINRLTAADVLVENRLFSTLDSTARRLRLPDGRHVVLSDTVGFIRHLPHHLVEAFRSTLEDVEQADVLIHVVDASDPDPDRQVEAVREVLSEIGAAEVPELIALNKADAAEPAQLARLANVYPNAVVVSAHVGTGMEQLLDRLSTLVESDRTIVRLEIPYARSDLVAAAHRDGEVLAEKHDDSGAILEVRLPKASLAAYAEFVSG